MPDVVDRETRRRMMSGIRNKNTKPEILIRKHLHRLGFRFRIHGRNLPGNPDLVLKKYQAVIFVNGCFWHRHECRIFRWPSTRVDFWRKKLDRNHANDIKVTSLLASEGWRVCVVWECAIRGTGQKVEKIIPRLATWIKNVESKIRFKEIKE